ncbi:MAG: hypothetical protein J0653_06985, partial [Deltaproteobacteria bacterium]|nr:hypothetical protein [Deltaproteobacteria bacterium]
KENAMFWIFILGTGLALTFAKLGAYSVLVSMLSSGLTLALLIIACMTVHLLWRKVIGGNKTKPAAHESESRDSGSNQREHQRLP